MTDIVVDLGSPSLGSPAVVSALIERTKQHLNTGGRETRNKLANSINSVEEGIILSFDPARVAPGSRLSIDLEDMHIWTSAGTSAVVQRGQYGSVQASHAAGATVFVDARYTPFEIFRELQNVLAALPGMGLYRMQTVDLTYSSALDGYDLTSVSNFLEIYEVYYDTGLRSNWRKVENYTYAPDMPAGSFPSTRALFIFDGGIQNRTIRVKYRAKFTPIASINDDVTSLGLPASAVDLLPLGAAINLVAGSEIRRNDITTQGDTRRPSEVPAGAALRSNLGLSDRFNQRLRQEVDDLYAQYPPLQPRIWNF